MKVFLLEDDPERQQAFFKALAEHTVMLAADAESAIRAIELDNNYDIFLLDHDLGGKVYVSSEDPNTGAAFLRNENVRKAIEGKLVVVHSLNPPGAHNMVTSAHDAGAISTWIPFTRLIVGLQKAMKYLDEGMES